MAADWWIAIPEGRQAAYVGRQSCVQCHQTQVTAWTGSHHNLAMDHATPESVLGDFEDHQFTHGGVTSRMFREGEQFYITTDGPDGEMTTYPIKFTFGVEPLQQYLVELNRGRIQALPIAWDTAQERWFHLYPDETLAHDDPLHWTQPAQNWNYMCADCHSTNVEKNYDLDLDAYHTAFSEIDVSCEACHGPGSLHVELAESRSLFWDRRIGYGLAPLKSKDSRIEIETCAKCHSRRHVIAEGHAAGQPLLDYYSPELIDGDLLYYADGQIRDEVYEYGSFLQSRMYREGVRCTDCHDPHTARLKAEDNQLCNQCHVPAKYDTPGHHFHAVGTRGANCVDCHMPQTTYMVVDPRRDHSIRVPRPDLTVALGIPNACNGCHDDQSAEWAQQHVEAWYGSKPDRPLHFAHAIAAGREGRSDAVEPLAAVARRGDVGPIVQASALALLTQYDTTTSREAIRRGLESKEPLVRAAAVRGCEGRPLGQRRELLLRLVADPSRLVRIEAARALADLPPASLPSNEQEALAAALAEYEAAQTANADQPAAHLNLAVYYEQQGRLEEAEQAYQTALRLDPEFSPAVNNLAMLYDRQGKKSAAERQLRRLVELEPASDQAYYSLGLLLAEDAERLDETAAMLARAAELAPDRARVRYNHALALQQLGRLDQAERELLAAADAEPNSADIRRALAIYYAQQQRWPQALEQAQRLVELNPADVESQSLRSFIRRESQRPATLGPAPR